MSESPRRTGRSIGAVVAGFFLIVVLSIGADELLRVTGIFPSVNQPMSDKLFVLATLYRSIFSVAGCYLTARLAPNRPMSHALALGVVGVVISAAGAVAAWNRGPEFGPHWYPIALVVLAMPCAWLGGKLRATQAPATVAS